jgi:PilZ domain
MRAPSELPQNVRALRRPAGHSVSAGRRFRANWPAELRSGTTRTPCTVVDISSAGACIKIETPLAEASTFRLVIAGIPPIHARSAWRRKSFVGLNFSAEQDWVLRAYRKRFDPAAWIEG